MPRVWRDVAAAMLTKAQTRVADLLVTGLGDQAIAAQLGRHKGTVKIHVRAIIERLGARNRVQAAVAWDRRQRG